MNELTNALSIISLLFFILLAILFLLGTVYSMIFDDFYGGGIEKFNKILLVICFINAIFLLITIGIQFFGLTFLNWRRIYWY